jgi:3-isopropylmalate/(R)-2-methylmalate dehydratase large subunit
MGMTMAEKVLARAAGLESIAAGQFVTAKVDKMMAHEGLILCAMMLMEAGVDKLDDPDKVIVILDHYFPAPNIRMADGHDLARQMVEKFEIKNFLGHAGICHQVMCEQGFVVPGQLVLGTDSHTTTYGAFGAAGAGIGQTEMAYVMATGELWMQVPPTISFNLTGGAPHGLMAKDIVLKIAGQHGTEIAQYKSIEFQGGVADQLSLPGRLTISNMGVELGAKFTFFKADEKTIDYLKPRTKEPVSLFGPDEDAVYDEQFELDISNLEPQVACPHNPGNVKSISEIDDVKVNQAFLGSCTNGRLEDLEIAAQILKGKKVNPQTRMLVAPASQEIILEATKAGYTEILMEAGAHIMPAGCGPCPGGHMGLLGRGEVCISSTNRNFLGRMGSEKSSVYLASPATVAASAIEGRITDPRKFWSETRV